MSSALGRPRSPPPTTPHATPPARTLARHAAPLTISSAPPFVLTLCHTLLSGAEFLVLACLVASACAFVPQPALMSRSKLAMSKQLETPKIAMSLDVSSLEQVSQTLAGVVAVDGGTGKGCGSNTRQSVDTQLTHIFACHRSRPRRAVRRLPRHHPRPHCPVRLPHCPVSAASPPAHSL